VLLLLDFVVEALVDLVGESVWNRLVSDLVATVLFSLLCLLCLILWIVSGNVLYGALSGLMAVATVVALYSHLA